MSAYILKFTIGNLEQSRGRALFYQDRAGTQEKRLVQSIDIDGIGLKEALDQEIREGRLILPEVFEPVFVKITPLDQTLSWEKINQLAQKEFRDVVEVPIQEFEDPGLLEVELERSVGQYVNHYKESAYSRLLYQLTRDLFRIRHLAHQNTYIALFQLAHYIYGMTRARREQNSIDLEYFGKQILSFQENLPYLCLKHIQKVLQSGDSRQWAEMADYIDTFYLTLKLAYPIFLENRLWFSVNKDTSEWLKQELPSLYQDYFLALLQENYERAGEIKSRLANRALCSI